MLRVILCAFIAAVSTVFGNLAIAYGKTVGLNTAITLWLVVAANFCALFTQPLFGKLADRIGRKPVFIYGAASSAIMMPFYLLSMSQGNEILTFALAIATFSCGYAAANAVWPSFYGEMFSTKVRFSGMAIGTQLGFLMAGSRRPSSPRSAGSSPAVGWSARSSPASSHDRDLRGPDRPRDEERAHRGAGAASGRGRPPLRADLELTVGPGWGRRRSWARVTVLLAASRTLTR